MALRQDLIDEIMVYLTFDQCIGISDYAALKLFKPRMLKNKYFYDNIDLKVIKLLHLNKINGWVHNTVLNCAKAGKIKEVEYILYDYLSHLDDKYYINFYQEVVLDSIPACGDLVKVKYFYEKILNIQSSSRAILHALENKNRNKKIEITKYILQTKQHKMQDFHKISKNDHEFIAEKLVITKSFDLVKMAYESGYKFHDDCRGIAIRNNQLDIASFIRSTLP